MRKNRFYLLALLLLSGCGSGGSEGGGGGGGSGGGSLTSKHKIVSASVSNTDKGLIAKNSSKFLAGNLTDNLIRVTADGSLSKVTFEVVYVENYEPVTTTISIDITEVITLSQKYVALKLADSRAGILNIETGDIYDITGINIPEMQVRGNMLYFLKDGTLIRVDLTDTTLALNEVNDPLGVTSNTGFSTSIFSSLDSPSSPFKYFSFNQYGTLSRFSSPSYIFASGNYVLAVSGPSGGERVVMFKENQQPYDCQLSEFSNVGGGFTGGVIQTANGDLYQIRVVTNAVAADRGARLVKYTFAEAGNCWNQVTVTDLGVIANLETSDMNIEIGVNYKLYDVNRYIVFNKGFLKTEDDGAGGVDFTWTSLDLSALPATANNITKTAKVEGDYVYWLSANKVYRTLLTNGASPELFFSGTNITKFEVASGSVVVMDGGFLKIIDTPGGTPDIISLLDDFDNVVTF